MHFLRFTFFTFFTSFTLRLGLRSSESLSEDVSLQDASLRLLVFAEAFLLGDALRRFLVLAFFLEALVETSPRLVLLALGCSELRCDRLHSLALVRFGGGDWDEDAELSLSSSEGIL